MAPEIQYPHLLQATKLAQYKRPGSRGNVGKMATDTFDLIFRDYI